MRACCDVLRMQPWFDFPWVPHSDVASFINVQVINLSLWKHSNPSNILSAE